jgi:tRNA1(Val) A37 N6-methylase TrmN6
LGSNSAENLEAHGWTDGQLSEDFLLGGAVKICQPKSGFRAAIDTVFMAASVPAKAGERVFEAGSGGAAAAICLARRLGSVDVTGVEIQSQLVRLANHNIGLNNLSKRVTVIQGDINQLRSDRDNLFDHAMANPPFLEEDRGNIPSDNAKAIATTLDKNGIKAWVEGIHSQLKRKGTVTLIWRADKMDQAIEALLPRFGAIKVFPLWPKAGRPAKRVILQARKGLKSPLSLLPGLILHREAGGYTERCEAILKGGIGLEF